jgi:hypothetical protein
MSRADVQFLSDTTRFMRLRTTLSHKGQRPTCPRCDPTRYYSRLPLGSYLTRHPHIQHSSLSRPRTYTGVGGYLSRPKVDTDNIELGR